MSWLFADGDLWLLVMMFTAGLMPVLADVAKNRPLGAEATLGGLLAAVCAVALFRRLADHFKAVSLRRRMLR